MTGAPDLDKWLPHPAMRVAHRRECAAPAEELWRAAQALRLSDTALLGRLVRWRIPGLPRDELFDQLFRRPPFMVLEEAEYVLVSGLVGRIWTLRRDYPELAGGDEFRAWSQSGTARVVFANWITREPADTSTINAEVRVEAIGVGGQLGVRAVSPLVRSFQHLIGTEGMTVTVRRAEQA